MTLATIRIIHPPLASMIFKSLFFGKRSLVIWVAISLLLSSCQGQSDQQSNIARQSPRTNIFATNATQRTELQKQISEVVRFVFQDSQGTFWFGTQNGLFKLEGQSLKLIDDIKSEAGNNVTIKSITEDPNRKLWVGHTDGISCIDGSHVTNYYESDGLISNDVWTIASDHRGHIWVGTIDGVCIFNGQQFEPFPLPEGQVDTTLAISSTRMIHSISQDPSGAIWICTNAGLFSYNHEKLTNVSAYLNMNTSIIGEIYRDKDGHLWISAKDGLYRLHDQQFEHITKQKIEIGKGIGSIAEDKDGNIWFVANQHDLYQYDGSEIIPYEKIEDNKGPVVFQIFKDQSDRLWFVGYGGAYRLENGKFLNITKDGPW